MTILKRSSSLQKEVQKKEEIYKILSYKHEL